ncbi:unnamed protein product [Meganyctiphanes norvegica]|uniref:Ig-like domain-containing protein n=1 Tax=Meganyctiphanes norvegica TaxID=48144 RepID=A0AAV2R937_MEGNR
MWYHSNSFLTPLLLLLVNSALGQIHDLTENYYDEYYENDVEPPSFVAKSKTITAETGETAVVPCDVANQGYHKLVIKKISENGIEQLLWVGSEKMARTRRLKMDMKTSRLTITHIRRTDGGTYICLFDISPPVELRHYMNVKFPPLVFIKGQQEQYVAQGSSITLMCAAEGNPAPIITWSRRDGAALPKDLENHKGESLPLKDVTRSTEGIYTCTANNGIGKPATASITLLIEFAPDITTERDVLRSGDGDSVELVCLVSGRPSPRVVWMHDGRPINPDMRLEVNTPPSIHNHYEDSPPELRMKLLQKPHRHTLNLKSVKEDDFGAYSCVAENALGDHRRSIQITGLPEPPHINSSPHGEESTRYTLKWKLNSYYPITEVMIKLRKVLQPNPLRIVPLSWDTISYVVEDVSSPTEGILHHMKHIFKDLEMAQDYVVNVRVRNKYGWSPESDHFDFSTQKGRQMAIQQTTVSEETSSRGHRYTISSSIWIVSTLLTVISSSTWTTITYICS